MLFQVDLDSISTRILIQHLIQPGPNSSNGAMSFSQTQIKRRFDKHLPQNNTVLKASRVRDVENSLALEESAWEGEFPWGKKFFVPKPECTTWEKKGLPAAPHWSQQILHGVALTSCKNNRLEDSNKGRRAKVNSRFYLCSYYNHHAICPQFPHIYKEGWQLSPQLADMTLECLWMLW